MGGGGVGNFRYEIPCTNFFKVNWRAWIFFFHLLFPCTIFFFHFDHRPTPPPTPPPPIGFTRAWSKKATLPTSYNRRSSRFGPGYISELFQRSVTNYNLRNGDFMTPEFKTITFRKHSITYLGPYLKRKLPLTVIGKCKKKITNWLSRSLDGRQIWVRMHLF